MKSKKMNWIKPAIYTALFALGMFFISEPFRVLFDVKTAGSGVDQLNGGDVAYAASRYAATFNPDNILAFIFVVGCVMIWLNPMKELYSSLTTKKGKGK